MKKCLLIAAVLAVALTVCSMANAVEREGRWDSGMGFGFNAGQGGNTSFAWQFGGDYYFNNTIAINPNFWVFIKGGSFVFGIIPRAKFSFNIPGTDNLEAFATGGIGVLLGDVTDWAFTFGGGMYYWLLDNHLGLGTDMNFAITGMSNANFRFVWTLASVLYRF